MSAEDQIKPVRVAAVILTHGEHESYRMILADLLDQGIAPEDVCIVHNPVTTEDRHVQGPAGSHVIRMPGNRGYAEAMNAGMQHQLGRGSEWIWLLTHDVRLRPGARQAMLDAARSSASYGALGPLLLVAGSDAVFSLGGARTRSGLPYNEGYGSQLKEYGTDGMPVRACAWLDGSSIMLRAEALREVGVYDTSMFGYTEDATLCLSLERAGWSVGIVQSAIAEQTAGQLSRPGPVSFLIARNGLRYVLGFAGPAGIAPALVRHVRDTVHYARLAVTGPRRRVALIQCFAMWMGVLAFLVGRSGPPPAWLPGRGDIGKG